MRSVTQNLINSFTNDEPLRPAALVDFGLDGEHRQDKWACLRNAFIKGLTNAEELDVALGNGEKLTEIAHRTLNAPGTEHYKERIVFRTAYDDLEGR